MDNTKALNGEVLPLLSAQPLRGTISPLLRSAWSAASPRPSARRRHGQVWPPCTPTSRQTRPVPQPPARRRHGQVWPPCTPTSRQKVLSPRRPGSHGRHLEESQRWLAPLRCAEIVPARRQSRRERK